MNVASLREEPRHGGQWSRLFQLVALRLFREIEQRFPEGTLHFAEIGVFYGGVSRLLLAECPRVHVHMIDPWDSAPDSYFRGRARGRQGKRGVRDLRNARLEALATTAQWKERRSVYQTTSREAIRHCPGRWLHMVFLDGDHRYDEVLHDCGWYDRIVPGGILCGHDWTCQEVQDAVKEFARVREIKEPELVARRVWRLT